MSLKAFHILFIIASVLLCFGFGAWSIWTYREENPASIYLWMGVVSFVLGLGLVVYGRYFLKKLRDVSYL